MQTFTGSSRRTEASWAAQVWTLIPYDPAGLDRLWDGGSTVPNQAEPDDQADPQDPADRTLTASAFVDKIFQIRFEAPPLVLSDWRGYLLRLLQEAFPGAPEEELAPLVTLRRLYPGVVPDRLVASEAPTPRQLKQFVNQVGAIRRQRDDVPLVQMGYYVLLRRDRFKVDRELLANQVPHSQLAYLLGEELSERLAALHYGTDQSLAQQTSPRARTRERIRSGGR